MAGPVNKKRKVLTMEELAKMTLLDAAKYLLSLINIYASVKEYIGAIDVKSPSVMGLFHARYDADGYSINTHVAPSQLSCFHVNRDDKGRIVSISDDKSIIKGVSLHKLLVVTYAKINGYSDLIIEEHDKHVEVMMLPQALEILDLPSDKKKDFHKEGREIHDFKGKINVYIPLELFRNVASLDYMTCSTVKNAMHALNNVIEKDDFKPDIKNLDSLGELEKLLSDSDRRAHSTFFNHLIGACVEKRSIEEKVLAFKTKPSVTFARTLGLVKPYAGRLITRGDLNEVDRTPLLDLDDDDDVLMSNVTIDQGFYESVGSKPGEILVYEATANIGLRKNKKFQQLPSQVTYTARVLLDILESIAASNKGKKKADAANLKSEPEAEDQDLEEVTL